MSVENPDHREEPSHTGHGGAALPGGGDRTVQLEREHAVTRGLTVAAGLVTSGWRTTLALASVTLLLVMAGAIRSWLERPEGPVVPDPPARGAELTGGPARLSDEDLEGLLRRRVQECLCDDGRLRLDPDGDAHDQIEAVFGPIYATNIPEFLDWHYTVVGQYTELAMAAAGRLEQEIDSRLFGNLTEQVELASGAIATMQESEARALLAQCIESEVQLLDADRETRELRVRMLNEAIGDARRLAALQGPSVFASLNEAIGDALRRLAASAGVSGSGRTRGAGVAGGLLVKAIVKKLLASIAVKTTGKSAVKAVGSWKGAAAVAAALSPLGPVGTVVGGVLGAAGGWFIVDLLAVEVDEFLNRDDLERELVALTDERRAETAAAMSAAIEARARAFDAMCLPRAFDEPESEPLGPFTPSELGDRR